jgi:hypothetical protein
MMRYAMKSKTGERRIAKGKMEMAALVCAGWIVVEYFWI